ncbi:cytochrome P450 [Williamsia serinedens]|uniref:Cytochrome P450 n=1 Tax=Williamsia serinedens TaxID=391736 RepID=A0ABT1H0T3_9NOCA|nr:cytochrome P450 [Williamsia serinedens]MCP2160741.1 Cytochrome P450 [Williamsia serinedens]
MTLAHESDLDTVLDYPFNRPDSLGLAPEYASIRRSTGLARVQLPFGEQAWLATRYHDVRTVLADPRFSRAVAVDHDEPRMRAGRVTSGILSMDPPDHSRLRTLVSRAFTPRRIEQLRPKAASICAGLVAAMRAEHARTGAPVDLVDGFALPLPVQVICELLGVPAEDRPLFRRWSDDAMSTTTLTAEEFDASREEFRSYMRDLLADKRSRRAAGEDPDDLMCALLDARDGEDRLTELELIDLCNGILVAGHETTASQIPNFLLFLMGRPDEFGSLPVPDDAWRSLHDDASLAPGVVEELMRLVPLGVGGGQARYATEDVELSGVVVRAGEPVLVSLASANRDPEVFERADEFDPTRGRSGHVGFGHGAHHCLGAALARVELQEALIALSGAFPGLRVTDVDWKSRMIVRGPRHLAVTW